MGPVTAAPPATDEVAENGLWFRVDGAGAGGGARRAAERLAGQLGFPPGRVGDVAVVAAELTSNLVKHAVGGTLLVRPVRAGRHAGVELFAVDSGPGILDLRVSARDGHSTAGTLGVGLGAIARMSSTHDVYSEPGRGTVVAVQVWPPDVPVPPPASCGVLRAMDWESPCGDGYAVRDADGRTQLLAVDGLGHGPLAAVAAQAATAAFRAAPVEPPAALVERLHRALSGTRGAAVAVAELDPAAGEVRYSGLGNIAGAVLDDRGRRGMVSLPGIAGHQRRTVREYRYPLPPAALVLLHSDGVSDRWQLDDYPGLLDHPPPVVAATVLRDAGVRRDDACVLVAAAS
ncbi:transcriptional regulator [Pilimelia terevasa]|uniref:Transcriptional regulator n=1 Tax=Pilimelia terevasa TaxID=53372 RepID=A0A8J3FKF6_9ACTN|nr:SpoIIE family protein phosphatase [Pilimelia terevasa]GGK39794.1 transcriptional regulator [Pilimelia terevasa]